MMMILKVRTFDERKLYPAVAGQYETLYHFVMAPNLVSYLVPLPIGILRLGSVF
jgi:hypothetical protein